MVSRMRWLSHIDASKADKNCTLQVRESRHKIDELEEKAALVDPVRANAQETELRDLRCKVEELQAGCDDRTLQVKPTIMQ